MLASMPREALRLATNAEELEAYRRLIPIYEELGVEYSVVGPERIGELHPLLNLEGLHGAAHTPGDGHVDPSGATHALAKAARSRGAEIVRQCEVTQIRQSGDGWEVVAGNEIYRGDHVVVASSFWAREMLAGLGLNLPLYPIQHHEVITGPVPQLAGLNFEVPTVRDPVAPSNTRQERDGFLCGVYEQEPEFWALNGIPPEFAEELLPPDTDRLETHLMRVIDRLPAFGDAGIKTVNNGPIAYTPDGCPLLGPVEGKDGTLACHGIFDRDRNRGRFG